MMRPPTRPSAYPVARALLAAIALAAFPPATPFASIGLFALVAQAPLTENTLRADGSAPAPTASIDDVAWLTGRWSGEGLGSVAEETWLPPAGDAMAGVFRLVGEDGVQFYEIVTVREEAGSLALRLKHFGPDLVGWEEREETVDFPLVAKADDTLWFDGLTMKRVSEDEMHIWVALEREGDSEAQEALFRYRRDPGTPEPR